MKVSVVTITCGDCGRLLSLDIPRVTDDDEAEVADQRCGPAFAQDWCRLHPLAPMLWNVRIRDTPVVDSPPAGGHDAPMTST